VRSRAARTGGLVAAGLAALLAGCGGGGSAPHGASSTTSSGASAPITIVQSADHAQFSAPAIFQSDSPGVVEVISTFPGGS
jgi:hypothetical protein